MASESNQNGGTSSRSQAKGGDGGAAPLRLPGEGFSIWLRELTAQKLPASPDPAALRSSLAPRTPVKAAQKKESPAAAAPKLLQLPGAGFSLWTRQEVEVPQGAIRLPGAAFTVWTRPVAEAPAPAKAEVKPAAMEVRAPAERAVEPVRASKVTFHDDEDYAPPKKGFVRRVAGKLSFLQWAALFLFLALLWGFLSRGTEIQKQTGLKQRYLGERNALQTDKEQLSNDLISTRAEVRAKVREIETLTATFNTRREALEGEVRGLQGALDESRGELATKQKEWDDRLAALTSAKETVEKALADGTASWEQSRKSYESESEGLKTRLAELGKAGEDLAARLASAEQTIGGLRDEKGGLEKNLADLRDSLASALSFTEEREAEWKKKLATAAEESGVTRTLQTQLANAEIAYRKAAEDNEALRGKITQLESALEEAVTTGKAGNERAAGLEAQWKSVLEIRDQLLAELQQKNEAISRLEQVQGEREKEAVNSAEYEKRLREVQDALAKARQDFGAREASLREQVAALNALKAKFAASLEERETRIAELDAKVAEAEKSFEEAGSGGERSAEQLQAELAALKQRVEDLRARLRLADDDKEKWNQFLEELRVRAAQIEEGLKSGGVVVEQPQP